MPDAVELTRKARALAIARYAQAEAEALYDTLKLAFTAEHAGLIKTIGGWKATVSAMENGLRKLAVEHYRETLNKKPTPGVSIITTTTATIEDDKAVFAWCEQHCKEALVLNQQMVKAIARASRNLPGIKVELVAVAQISESLTSILGIDGAIAHDEQREEEHHAADAGNVGGEVGRGEA